MESPKKGASDNARPQKGKSLSAHTAICTGVGWGNGIPPNSMNLQLDNTTDNRNGSSDYHSRIPPLQGWGVSKSQINFSGG